MSIKVRIEIDREGEEEVIIRCKEITPEVVRLQKLAENAFDTGSGGEMSLRLGDNEFFVALDDILFFEALDNRTAAHTSDRMYTCSRTLVELSESLPSSFMRISKSCIANIRLISSLHREITGVCEATFNGSIKKVYISRMYYKPFRERLIEIRLNGKE